MDVRRARSAGELVAAEGLFDGPVRPEWCEGFLAQTGHLMLIASVDGVPVGMASGVEMTHPDKGTEEAPATYASAGTEDEGLFCMRGRPLRDA